MQGKTGLAPVQAGGRLCQSIGSSGLTRQMRVIFSNPKGAV